MKSEIVFGKPPEEMGEQIHAIESKIIGAIEGDQDASVLMTALLRVFLQVCQQLELSRTTIIRDLNAIMDIEGFPREN